MVFYKDLHLKKIMTLLNDGNKSPRAMYVGGCVRDHILDLPIKDIDIATIHTPDKVTKILKQAFKILPIGIEYGTVVAVTPIGNVQITTLRHDIETNGRHAVVSFTDDWAEDAMRRDFTINTLLMDMRGNIIDPLQAGIRDLKRGIVRFVGDADERVGEDVLRILRYVRFHARFGRGALDNDYLKIFKQYKTLFQKLSRERVTEEILKTIQYPSAFKYLKQFERAQILPLPKIAQDQIKIFETLSKSKLMSTELALALWAHGSRTKWNRIKSYLKLSNAAMMHIDYILQGQKLFKATDRQTYLLLLYRYKRDVARHIIIFGLAKRGETSARIKSELKKCDALEAPVFPVSGKDLIARGFTAGPALGATLRALETKWIKSGFKSASLDAMLRK